MIARTSGHGGCRVIIGWTLPDEQNNTLADHRTSAVLDLGHDQAIPGMDVGLTYADVG